MLGPWEAVWVKKIDALYQRLIKCHVAFPHVRKDLLTCALGKPLRVPIVVVVLILELAGFLRTKFTSIIWRTLTIGWVQVRECLASSELQDFALQLILVSVEIGHENLAFIVQVTMGNGVTFWLTYLSIWKSKILIFTCCLSFYILKV